MTPDVWAASIGGNLLLVRHVGRVLPLQLLAFEECYACWAHLKHTLDEDWAFASSISAAWQCRVRLATLARQMLERVVPLAPTLTFPDTPPWSTTLLPTQARDVLEYVGYYTNVALQRATAGTAGDVSLITVLPLLLQLPCAHRPPLLLLSHAARRLALGPAEMQPPPSPPPSPTPPHGDEDESLDFLRQDWVNVRLVRELAPEHYASHTQSFNYRYATIRDIFEFMIERLELGHRNTHVLALESMFCHNVGQTIAEACHAARVEHLDALDHCPNDLDICFELFHHADAAHNDGGVVAPRDDWVVVRIVRELADSSYSSHSQSFSYRHANLRDIFEFMIERLRLGRRDTHVLALGPLWWHDMDQSIADICDAANVEPILSQESDPLAPYHADLEVSFELFHQSNAAVQALSRHATSVHLGDASDATAQADFSMAHTRLHAYEHALAQLASPDTPDIALTRAARTLAQMTGDVRVRPAGLRAVQAVAATWRAAPPVPRHVLLHRFQAARTTYDYWLRRLNGLRGEMRQLADNQRRLEDERQVALSLASSLGVGPSNDVHDHLQDLLSHEPPLDTSDAAPPVGSSSSSSLPQEVIRYMRAAIRASLGLAAAAPEAPTGVCDAPAAAGSRVASPARPSPARPARTRSRTHGAAAPQHLEVDAIIEQQRASNLEALRADDTDGALHFSDAQASWFAHELGQAEQAAVNRDTARRDDAWWRKYWLPITTMLATAPVRNFPAAVSGEDPALRARETTLLIFALITILTMMQPRRREAPAPKISSGLHVLLGVRRIHARMGVELVPFKLIRETLKGLTMRFVQLHGHEALLAKRKAPLPHSSFQALLLVCAGTYNGIAYVGLLVLSTRAVMCLMWASGFRKAELVSPIYHLRVASLVWWLVLDGGPAREVPNPTETQLAAALDGSFVEVWPRMSKCDATGAVWGDKKTFHTLNDRAGSCFRALRALVIALQRRGAYSPDTPLFITDDASLVTASQAQRLLEGLLVQAGLGNVTHVYSWHSFRISLATRLGRVGCPPDKIQALCRWQSPESLLIYRRMGLPDYRQWIEQAAFDADFEQGSLSPVCIESTPGVLALADAPSDDPPCGAERPRQSAPRPAPAPSAPPPPLTMRNAVGRTVLVPILPGWEQYPCDEHDGNGWTARVVATRAHAHVSLRFTHARDAEGRKYPDHTLPLHVLQELPL